MQSSAPGVSTLARAVRVVSGVTLLSRLGGLAREILTARIFGDTAIGSAFAAGFQVPNLFRRLFGEGALSAAFIPHYAQLHKRDPEASHRFASLVVLTLLLVTTALTVLIELGLLMALVTLPRDPDRDLSLGLIMVMLPYMPLVCGVAILGGMLQVHGKFAASSSGPIVMNAMIVAVGLYFLFTGQLGGTLVAYLLGVVVVLSGVTQAIWFLRLLQPHVRWTRDTAAARADGRVISRKFVPAAIGLGTLQINTFLDTLLAMWPIWVGATVLGVAYPMDERSNVLLQGAARLYQFPLGVFGIAVATAVFPMLSRHADEPAHFIQTLRRGIRLSLFIGLPASAGLFLVRHDAIAVPYAGGASGYSDEGVARAAAVLGGFATAVWAYSLNHVLTRAFYAKGDTRTPMRVAIGMVLFNAGLNLALMWSLREAGLAWSTAIAAAAQCIVLTIIAARRFAGEHGALLDRPTITAIARLLAATTIMAATVWAVGRWTPRPAGWLGNLTGLGVMSAAGIAAYVAATRLLGCHELGWLVRPGARRSTPASDDLSVP